MLRVFLQVFCLTLLGVLHAEEALEPLALYEIPGSSITWQTDLDKAQQESIETHRPILIVFTGSDWCHACQKLQETILTKDEFVKCVKDSFVFVNIDFPLHHRLTSDQIAINQELKKRFQIEGFPTAVVMMPSGDVMLFAGNFPSNPSECGALFLKNVKTSEKLAASLDHFDKTKFSGAELEELYAQAQQWGKTEQARQILQAGFEKGDSAFFLREKYRELQEMGEGQSLIAKQVRADLLALDPDNAKGHHLYVAVSDFEALSKKNPNKKSVAAATPLLTYLEHYGPQDAERWRVELMLAHFFDRMGESTKAIQFAKAAYQRAPEQMKGAIESSIHEMETSTH